MFTCTGFKILAACNLRRVLRMVMNNWLRCILQMSKRLQGRGRGKERLSAVRCLWWGAKQGGADKSLPLVCP